MAEGPEFESQWGRDFSFLQLINKPVLLEKS
jgi:hypothetical protein